MRKRLAAAMIGASLLVGACSGSGDSSPLATILAAPDRTQDAGSARMWMTMDMGGPTGRISTEADGIFDIASKRGEMTMQMEAPDAPAGTPDLGTTEAVYDGTMIYMKMPALSSQLPQGKPWIRMDLQAMGEEIGFDMGALMQASSSDPTQSLHYLRGASGEIEVVGEEEVRGANATHYRAVLSLDKVVEQAPDDVRERLRPGVDMLKEWIGSDEIPVEVWIDEEGRAVRLIQTLEYVGGPAAGTTMEMTVEMYDFGAPVDVKIPPNSQVTDFEELLQGAP